MAMKMQVVVFGVVMPCSDVGYQRFGEPCCLHLQGEVKVLRNVGILPHPDTIWQPRRLPSSDDS